MASSSSSSNSSIKGGKWPEWLADDFPPSRIDTSLFTHVYYAFLNPNQHTFQFEISCEKATELESFTRTLHSKNPTVKALFSIGGWSEGAEAFARMASNAASRKTFISSSIEVARKYNFDGIDFDCEFPRNQPEMDNLGCLFNEWRSQVVTDANGSGGRQPLLLSASVYYRPQCYDHDQLYPINSINESLDYINVMCYNYYGSWNTRTTGNHAALYNNITRELSTSYGIESWIERGVIRSKLIMGLPLFGRTFRLQDPNSNGIGAPATGVSIEENGYLLYKDIVNFNSRCNATVKYDETTKSTYSYSGTHWIGYDDEKSIKKKLEYAKDKRLGGYTFFAIGYDNNWQLSEAASEIWDGHV